MTAAAAKPLLLPLLLLPIPLLVAEPNDGAMSMSQQDVTVSTTCSASSCNDCLAQGETCVWHAQEQRCSPSCPDFPDPDCYYSRMFAPFPATVEPSEICGVAEDLQEDNAQCFQKTDELSCRYDIGCFWLGGVEQLSGRSTYWCVLHLESTIDTNSTPAFELQQETTNNPTKALPSWKDIFLLRGGTEKEEVPLELRPQHLLVGLALVMVTICNTLAICIILRYKRNDAAKARELDSRKEMDSTRNKNLLTTAYGTPLK